MTIGRKYLVTIALIAMLALALGAFGAYRFLEARRAREIEVPPELQRLIADPEMDSLLHDLLRVYRDEGEEATIELARQRGILDENDEVRMTIVLDTEDTHATVALLERKGVRVEGVYKNLITIAVPLEVLTQYASPEAQETLLEELSQLEHVIEVRLPDKSFQDGNLTPGQGVNVTGAEAWHQAGFRGQGVKVGVLDLGFAGYQALLGKDLPDHVTVKSFVPGQEVGDGDVVHGTACAEIVHEMAPEAELFFAWYDGNSDTSFGQAVQWLLEQGVDIITNSTSGIAGPMDGTGEDAQVVDDAYKRGVLWVNSAGNSAEEHYAGVFTDADGDGWHEFAPGQETMTIYPYSKAEGATVVLNWDDWQNRTEDYDLYLLDDNKNVVDSSRNPQVGIKRPVEWVVVPNDGFLYSIAIKAESTTRPARFNLFTRDGEPEFPVPTGSLCTPADARGSLTVGATYWQDDSLEDFSSQGPTTDGRIKPELAAPDGVDTASYAPRAFYGTSASTPYVAGAAALVLSAYPDYSPQQVLDYLAQHALDLGPPGQDNMYGHGRLRLPSPPSAPAPRQTELVDRPTPPQVVTGASLSDSFDDPSSGLEQTTTPEYSLAYEGGEYHIRVQKTGLLAWSVYGQVFADFTVQVTSRQVEGPDASEQGLIFRYLDETNFYFFVVTGDGWYHVGKYVDDVYAPVIEWEQSPHIRTGVNSNRLELQVQGDKITIVVNGQTLASATDDSFVIGYIGLLAGSLDQPGVHVAFDDLAVTAP